MSEPTSLEEATQWMLRLHGTEADPDTFMQWQRWLAEAPEHREAYEQIERTMSRLADLEATPELPSAVEMAADTYDGSVPVAEYLETNGSGVQSGMCDAPADRSGGYVQRCIRFAAALGEALHLPTVRYAMASCVAAALVGFGWMGLQFFEDGAESTVVAYATAPAQRETIRLPDGSRITLDADSAISVELGSHERVLRLMRGEAYFQVAKDPNRPFIVSAGGARARAIGTAFNVRMSDQRTVVAVVEGIVEVQASSYSNQKRDAPGSADAAGPQAAPAILVVAHLGAGQAVAYEGESGLRALAPRDALLATSWLDGRRQYRNESLQYVLADLERYSGRRIKLADAETGALKFTGTLSVENSQAWLKALTIALPVTVVQDANEKIVVSLNQPAASASKKDPNTTVKDVLGTADE